MRLIYILSFFLLCLTTSVVAQVTVSTQTKMVAVNETFFVELRATTRDSLSSLQFSFSWNPAVLAFQQVDTLGGFPPSAESAEFNTGNTATGKLAFLWITNSLRGYRVPSDSFLIFKIVFKAVGANGTSSPLQFVGTPTPIKASNADLLPLAVTNREGSVKVGTTALFSPNTEGVLLGQNFPNPVDNQTVIPVDLTNTDDVALEVTDLKGKIILMRKYHFGAGRHEIRLDTEGVLQNGIFIYNIRTSRGIASRVMIKH